MVTFSAPALRNASTAAGIRSGLRAAARRALWRAARALPGRTLPPKATIPGSSLVTRSCILPVSATRRRRESTLKVALGERASTTTLPSPVVPEAPVPPAPVLPAGGVPGDRSSTEGLHGRIPQWFATAAVPWRDVLRGPYRHVSSKLERADGFARGLPRSL